MNKKHMIIAVAITIGVLALGYTPQHKFATDYEVWIGTSVASPGTDLTLAGVSFDCIIANDDSTSGDTLTFSLNAEATPYTLYGGDKASITEFPITAINITSINNTPDYRVICFELE